jgi:hypothetical protein
VTVLIGPIGIIVFKAVSKMTDFVNIKMPKSPVPVSKAHVNYITETTESKTSVGKS